MGKRIVIAGAGGFGRGVYAWLAQSPQHRQHHDISDVAFIDDGAPAVLPQAPVVSSIESYEPQDNDAVLCAIGVPAVRRRIVELLTQRGATLHTFVDDRAVLGSSVTLGKGTIICPGTVVSSHAKLGEQVHLNFNCSVGHDTNIGAYSTLSPSVNVMGEVTIGAGVFLGGSAVVLPRLSIDDEFVIGAGAVVVRSARHLGQPTHNTLIGNPARKYPNPPNVDEENIL